MCIVLYYVCVREEEKSKAVQEIRKMKKARKTAQKDPINVILKRDEEQEGKEKKSLLLVGACRLETFNYIECLIDIWSQKKSDVFSRRV